MGSWTDLALECARAARVALQLDPAVSPVAVVRAALERHMS